MASRVGHACDVLVNGRRRFADSVTLRSHLGPFGVSSAAYRHVVRDLLWHDATARLLGTSDSARNGMRETSAAQQHILSHLVRELAPLPVGRRLGLDRLRDAGDLARRFRAGVPISSYADVADLIERVAQNEADVLFPGRAVALAQTSGTTRHDGTGERLIPQSERLLRHHASGGMVTLARAMLAGGPALAAGRFLMLGGSTALQANAAGVPVGDLSGICAARMPRLLRHHYEPGLVIALENDWRRKLERIVARCGPRDVRVVAGVPSWCLVLFAAVCAQRGATRVSDVWRHLDVLVYGGHAVEPFLPALREHLAPTTRMLEVYAASEAFLAVGARAWALSEDHPAPLELLCDRGVYLELVPDGGRADEAVGPYDIESGQIYAPLVTTPGGLVRYEIGDRVLGIGPGLIRFAGRSRTQLSVFGEHVEGYVLAEALERACALSDATVTAYHVAPFFPTSQDPRGAHEWSVEFARPPQSCAGFACALDAYLCDHVMDYAAHRRGDAQLLAPRVVALPAGTFENYLARLGRLGGQHKVPQAWPDRSVAEELARSVCEVRS